MKKHASNMQHMTKFCYLFQSVNKAVTRTLIGEGVHFHILMFCPTDFFSKISI